MTCVAFLLKEVRPVRVDKFGAKQAIASVSVLRGGFLGQLEQEACGTAFVLASRHE
jgi:hypothetical protein